MATHCNNIRNGFRRWSRSIACLPERHYNDSLSGPCLGCSDRRLEFLLPIPPSRPRVVRYRRLRRRRRGLPPVVLAVAVIAALLGLTWSHVSAGRGTELAASPTSSPTLEQTTTSLEAVVAPVPSTAPVMSPPTPSPNAVATATVLPTATSTVVATATPAPFYSRAWLLAHPATHPPVISAKAAIVIDYDTRQILYESNPHERLAQASTTKITLVDVALDVAPPTLPITISKEATEVVPDHMGVQVGEVLTLEELLYGALLDSGNDAGWAIAQGIGSLDHTVALMNKKAVDLGMRDSHYVNPVGFDDPQHYSSAYDLAVVTADALTRHPLLRQIVSTKRTVIESTKTHGWFGPTNLNSLLWDYPGAWGVKPGWTENAGYCLVAAATRNGHTVLVTLLGSKDHFADGTALLNYGFARIAAGEH